ncbi:hypothetical protein M2475_000194 [Breznakia sp. PF5-3]|uniref:hypothetical protein n=1 Tax=unclassified Breznakia TaxID=2623764 RepID=UPI002406D864|nr:MULTISPECIES: hypothetical protein [unclassified Breznakia]MDL2276403.1 hypothetical protein [Breznakia sp. OttesenSCG-928-G09]MDF9823789.1 hypothetical protein [Breznakia sp. PM6-1]MDF9834645.1 hypothetical protein [Breznakia sp. PF5-3]MDF9836738.1 hypothetical protein [Breznakia sp. PFB2-8]MDF9858813.1 hypothetical protein [Breznakia sp. PH5-24]
MKSLKPENKIEALLFLFAFIILPIFSILLGVQESIFYENLTYIGNQPQYRLLFQIWGITISLDYFFSFYYLTKKTKVYGKRLLPIAAVLSFISILSFFIPYNAHQPLLSNLHVYTSLSSSLLTICLIFYYVHLFQFDEPAYYQKCFRCIIAFMIICVTLLLILGDISGILELVMTLFLSVFLYYMIRIY